MARDGTRTGGRVAGTPNKTTVEFKQAVINLMNFAAPQMTGWLTKVASQDPSKALDHVHRMAEYAFPKIQRTELTGKDGDPLELQVRDVTARVLKEIPQEKLEALIADATEDNRS